MIRLLVRLAALAGGASWLLGKMRGRAERIQLDGPGELDLVTSPVAVSGTAQAAQHNTLAVKVRDENGAEIGSGSVAVSAAPGRRGPFAGTVSYILSGPSQRGRIEVFDTSPRDGQITHLASVEVTLS